MNKSHSLPNRWLEFSRKHSLLTVVFVLLGLIVCMFADVLFTSKQIVLSNNGADLSAQFIYWRDFGVSQIKQGNLPLWNPHIFCGAPYMGGFQSALFYPPNLIYLVLPLARAINLSIIIHVFLGGLFMYLWTAYRKLHPLACLVAAVLFMFCGPHFLHIFAGHLPNLCTLVWVPLLFLGIDGFFEKRSFGFWLLGTFAITMMLLAGHPQYVFYTAVACAIYCGLCFVKAKNRLVLLFGFAMMGVCACGLSAVQLFTGMDAAGQSLRSAGLSYEFASKFSFHPENLITFISPYFLGNIMNLPYWGQDNLWELNAFVGLTALIMALYGAVAGERRIRRFSIAVAAFMLLFALGAYTPLFKVLYNWVPGFDKFRGNSKFILQAAVFIIMLTAVGFDRLLKSPPLRKRFVIVVLLLGIFVGILGLAILNSAETAGTDSIWYQFVLSVQRQTGADFVIFIRDPDQLVMSTADFAAKGLFIASAISIAVCILILLRKRTTKVVYVIAFLAVVEIFVFARTLRPTFNMELSRLSEVKQFIEKNPGDYRVLNGLYFNSGMSIGANDIWGYDPGLLRRYGEFIAFTQGTDPDEASQNVKFTNADPLYKMLRLRYAFVPQGTQVRVEPFTDVMGRLELIGSYKVISERDQIFEAMSSDDFDPGQKVILEEEPNPAPAGAKPKGIVSILDSSTDHMTIQADLETAGVLLITDNYSKGWRVKPLAGCSQDSYQLLPANYILMAVPLGPGHHLLRLEYLPRAFQIGKWVSVVSVAIYILLLLWFWRLQIKTGLATAKRVLPKR